MSDYERNIGTLIPIKFNDSEEWAERLASEIHKETTHNGYDSFLEMIKDDPSHYGLEVVNGRFYTAEFKIRRGSQIDDHCFITVNKDGVIHFDTFHYNGSACYTELIGAALAKEVE